MAMLKAFRDNLKAGLRRPRFTGYGGRGGFGSGWGWLQELIGGSAYDYRKEAGNLWENSIVLACLNWVTRNAPDAPPILERKTPEDTWEKASDDHGLTDLLENPNPDYDATVLWAGTYLSWFVDGNAYWLKVRSGAGKIVQLYYLPHWMVEPRWPEDGSAFISHYEYRVDGKEYGIRKEDIVHFRNGLNPHNIRKGMSDLAAVLREVCTDNEAALFSASLLRNMGVPGVILSPKDKPADFNDEKKLKFQEMWREKFTGDGRGLPFVNNFPLDVNVASFSPSDMDVAKMRRLPEERITSAFGIPAVVVGLGAGLESSNDKHNITTAQKMAWLNCLLPVNRQIGRQGSKQLLPDMLGSDPTRERIGFDTSDVPALQEDQNEAHKRHTEACGGAYMTVNEVRDKIKLKPVPDGDKLRENKPPEQPGEGESGKPKPKPSAKKTEPEPEPDDEVSDES